MWLPLGLGLTPSQPLNWSVYSSCLPAAIVPPVHHHAREPVVALCTVAGEVAVVPVGKGAVWGSLLLLTALRTEPPTSQRAGREFGPVLLVYFECINCLSHFFT